MNTKICSKCKVEKDFSLFYKHRSHKDGIYSSCIECEKKHQKEFYQRNRERLIEKVTKYVNENKDKVNLRKRERNKIKRKENINFKLSHYFRTRIFITLNRCLQKKKVGSIKYLGCSIEEYKKYLESLFEKGMNWDNYGFYGWHIDHTIPISKFDLSVEEEKYLAFNYKNTKPMWSKDNWKKGAKYEQ